MVGPHPNSSETVIFSGELMVQPLIGWSGIIVFGSLMPSHTGIGSSHMGINLFGPIVVLACLVVKLFIYFIKIGYV